MIQDVELNGCEMEVTFYTEEVDTFTEDFGCGSETCYPSGHGVVIIIESVVIMGNIDILPLLNDKQIEEIEHEISCNL